MFCSWRTKLFLWQAEQGSRRTRRHPRDDPRAEEGEDVHIGVGVRVGAVECQLYKSSRRPSQSRGGRRCVVDICTQPPTSKVANRVCSLLHERSRLLPARPHRTHSVLDASCQLLTIHMSVRSVVCLCLCVGHAVVKVKFSNTRYLALGPELIPVYRQSAHR